MLPTHPYSASHTDAWDDETNDETHTDHEMVYFVLEIIFSE